MIVSRLEMRQRLYSILSMFMHRFADPVKDVSSDVAEGESDGHIKSVAQPAAPDA